MQIIKLSNFRIFRTFSELKLWFIFIYEHIANQNSDRLIFQLVSYFTNFAVQNVNKAFVYITDLTSTLNFAIILKILKVYSQSNLENTNYFSCTCERTILISQF